MTTIQSDESVPSRELKIPSDSAFKQQRLPAWQPVLTARTVLPTFFAIGVMFIPIGFALLYSSRNVHEELIDYTQCKQNGHTNRTCAEVISDELGKSCQCNIPFTIKEDMIGTVYMYYGLTNYYQNHRRYVKSRDDEQLLGRLSSTPSTDCVPFASVTLRNDYDMPIAPCGAIANSLFNDTLKLSYNDKEIKMLNTGIAWPSDKHMKFRNPEGDLKTALKDFAKPKSWQRELWELDPHNASNNGFQNEDLIVWMRTAALPSFRKLYRRLNQNVPQYADGLKAGNYTLEIDYQYPVNKFYGTKRMILSTTSFMGGKNAFLGYAYMVVGLFCLAIGMVLLVIHLKCSKSNNEMMNVNPRTPYS